MLLLAFWEGWDKHRSATERRRDRRQYAETIDRGLDELQRQLYKQGNVLDEVLQGLKQGQWCVSQQMFPALGKLDSLSTQVSDLKGWFSGSNLNTSGIIKYVEVPKIVEVTKIVEIPKLVEVPKFIEASKFVEAPKSAEGLGY